MLHDEYELLHYLVDEIAELHADGASESELFRGPSFGVRYMIKNPDLEEDE